MKNFDYCAYTYRHRRAVEYLANKLIKDQKIKAEMLKKIQLHDMDKLIMYQFLEKDKASKIHRETASHHMGNDIPKTYLDKLEAILDYESAGYTKPDKPLNAYDTLLMFRDKRALPDDIINELLDITKDLGINSSYSVTNDLDGMKYLEQFKDVSEEDIENEILKYITTIS